MTIEQLEESIVGLSLMDAAQLVKRLEERLGVSAQAQTQTVQPQSIGEQPVVEEKTEYTVVLTGTGETKINVIKALREITTLGLKEAKDLSENLPKKVKEELSKADAEAIATKLRSAGATVEIN
jgi:large subunit ribosomal protein L7/L12